MNRHVSLRFTLDYGPGEPNVIVELTYSPNTFGDIGGAGVLIDEPESWSVAEHGHYVDVDGGEDQWTRWDDTYEEFTVDHKGAIELRQWMARYLKTDAEWALFDAFVAATYEPKPTYMYAVQYTNGIRQAMWAVEATDAVDAIRQRWSPGDHDRWAEVELESLEHSLVMWAGRTFVNRFNGASVTMTAMLQEAADA